MSKLVLTQGVSSGYRWPMVDADKQPADLTGYSAKCQIRTGQNFDAPLLKQLIAEVDGSAVIVKWDSEDSYTWDFDKGYYDVVLINPQGIPKQIISQGEAIVDKVVTDARTH